MNNVDSIYILKLRLHSLPVKPQKKFPDNYFDTVQVFVLLTQSSNLKMQANKNNCLQLKSL